MGKNESNGVYKNESGHWCYRYSMVVNGKVINRRQTKNKNGEYFKSKRECLTAKIQDMEEQKQIILDASSPVLKITPCTVAELFDEYSRTTQQNKSHGTILKQNAVYNNHLRNFWGKKLLTDITPADVYNFLSEKYENGYKYSYVASMLKLFYLIYREARTRNHISNEYYNLMCVDPVTRMVMPPKQLVETDGLPDVFNSDELDKLDTFFKNRNSETAYMLGRYCGLRISETYGLLWKYVNFEEHFLLVRRQMADIHGVKYLTAPKTQRGFRTIPLNNTIYAYLYDLYQKQQKNRKERPELWGQNNQIIYDICEESKTYNTFDFVNVTSEGLLQSPNSWKYPAKILRSNGIDAHYHKLRHTFGTYLAATGTPEVLLCQVMGHSSIRVTEKYYIGASDKGLNNLREYMENM